MDAIIPIGLLDAAALGRTRAQVALDAAGGRLTRIRQGYYLEPETVRALDERSLHRARVHATARAARHRPVFSHESAAVLHGIPWLGHPPGRAVVTTTAPRSSNRSVLRHQAALDPADIVMTADGLRATSPGRTAIDLAARQSMLSGIIAVSHVRWTGVDMADLVACMERMGPFQGVSQARTALDRSTSGSESPLESLVVARCQDLGFAVPDQQTRIVGVDGRRYRVDFSWHGGRVLGEADGYAKYLASAESDARSPEERLRAEKAREDALRPACERFVRVTWAEAWNGIALARRLTAAGVPRIRPARARLTF